MKGVRHPDLPLTPEQQQLVLSCRWLARQQVGRYAKGRLADDLESGCYMALVRAAQTFDPGRGVKFTTWYMWWVRAFIGRAKLLAQPLGYRNYRNGVPPTLFWESEEWLGGRREPDLADQAERCERILDLVRAMPHAPGRVARLVWVEGLSTAEAAQRLGLKPRSAKTFLSEAKHRLREALEREEAKERRKQHPDVREVCHAEPR